MVSALAISFPGWASLANGSDIFFLFKKKMKQKPTSHVSPATVDQRGNWIARFVRLSATNWLAMRRLFSTVQAEHQKKVPKNTWHIRNTQPAFTSWLFAMFSMFETSRTAKIAIEVFAGVHY